MLRLQRQNWRIWYMWSNYLNIMTKVMMGKLKSWKIFNFKLHLISLVVNAYKKLLFQELKVWPTLTPGDYKQFNLSAPGGLQTIRKVSEPLCSREETSSLRKKIKNHQMKGCWENCWTATFVRLTFFLNSKPLTFVSSL